ncbi:NAD(P)-dependent oxidoreductase [Gemmatimonas sp.]|jgi:3-hydroxyisobutyrate dehydrogenase|uniref:NAD(P)-dependent oxidoreductase n=1 Tax=Gemmatimonas sp. TaxID=1962908 RepID=UPI0037BE6C19
MHTAHDAEMADTVRIGFIGLGLIGAPMVERLLECGREVTIWNRSPEKCAPLVAAGARLAPSAQQVGRDTDIVCLCLTDTAAVQDVVFGTGNVVAGLREESLVVDLSSIAPDATRTMAHALDDTCGASWLDAPVSGGVPAARAGRLIVFAGGNANDVARATPVFSALAQRVTHMGGHGAGQLAKSCNQQIVACNLLVIAEMLAFAERAGVDVSRLPEALAGGFADSLPLQIFGPRMVHGTDQPRLGAVGTFNKDIAQVVRLAEEVGAAVPLTQAALARYAAALAHAEIGHDADASRLIRLVQAPADGGA